MRQAVSELKSEETGEAVFFEAHLKGVEKLAELQSKWLYAEGEERERLKIEINQLREKLLESLEVLRE